MAAAKGFEWVTQYLRLIRSGMRPGAAAKSVGITRQTPCDARKRLPGFAHDEQRARDDGEVQLEIERQEAMA